MSGSSSIRGATFLAAGLCLFSTAEANALPASSASQSSAPIGEQEFAAIKRMTSTIQANWNPDCRNEAQAQVRVSFTLDPTGSVVGQVTVAKPDGVDEPAMRVAAERAIGAVYRSAPFQGLPPTYYGQKITLNFKARDACAAR
jgi:outer membrane biosynthesis protein TonB